MCTNGFDLVLVVAFFIVRERLAAAFSGWMSGVLWVGFSVVSRAL